MDTSTFHGADVMIAETKSAQVPRLRAAGCTVEEETGTMEGAEDAPNGTNASNSATESAQVLRLRAAGRTVEEESLRSGTATPPAKRSRGTLTARWTVASERDDRGKEDSLRRYRPSAPNTAARRARTRYPGPLLFGLDVESKRINPHIEPRAMESLLQGLNSVIQQDERLGNITTKWAGPATEQVTELRNRPTNTDL
jgi:hypothetical protein